MMKYDEKIKILIDGMGGDNAPASVVKGSIDFVKNNDSVEIVIIGNENEIKEYIDQYSYTGTAITIKSTTEIIYTADEPVNAIRNKKDSSLVVGMKMLKEGYGDAFISAGNSGAILVGSHVIVGCIKGIKNIAMAVSIPTIKGNSLLIDAGARVDVDADTLLQYAISGKAYVSSYFNIKNPTIGILNIGTEINKGNALVKKAVSLFNNRSDLNFIGSIEAREVLNGVSDIIITEGFVGNICIKSIEGAINFFIMSINNLVFNSFKNKIGAFLIKNSIKNMLKKYDVSKYGGAPLLGSKEIVVKVHGNAGASEITSTIAQCVKLVEENFINKLNISIEKS